MEENKEKSYDSSDYYRGIRMTALKNELDNLTDLMKTQECYKKYRELLKLIQKDEVLYAKLNEFRKKNVELHYHKQTLKEEAHLEKQYHDFLTEDLISEFLFPTLCNTTLHKWNRITMKGILSTRLLVIRK